jgi:hypothetical protein
MIDLHPAEDEYMKIADFITEQINISESKNNYEIGFGFMGTGITVFNNAVGKNEEPKIVAYINADRSITYYDSNLPEETIISIKEAAEKIDDPVFVTQPDTGGTLAKNSFETTNTNNFTGKTNRIASKAKPGLMQKLEEGKRRAAMQSQTILKQETKQSTKTELNSG